MQRLRQAYPKVRSFCDVCAICQLPLVFPFICVELVGNLLAWLGGVYMENCMDRLHFEKASSGLIGDMGRMFYLNTIQCGEVISTDW